MSPASTTDSRRGGGLLHALNVVVLVGVTTRAWLMWDRIPARVPIHFDSHGVPNRWTSKGGEFGVLFALPWFVELLLYGMMAAMVYFRRHPEYVNLPKRLRDLPPERLGPFFDAAQDCLLWVATAAICAVGAALHGTLQVALGLEPAMPAWTVRPGLVALAVAAVAGIVRMLVVSSRLTRGDIGSRPVTPSRGGGH